MAAAATISATGHSSISDINPPDTSDIGLQAPKRQTVVDLPSEHGPSPSRGGLSLPSTVQTDTTQWISLSSQNDDSTVSTRQDGLREPKGEL